jgi:polysaccharide biosynthesis protein PelG
MAGIGFELRKLLSRDSYAGLLGAYGYAGIASSGPWVVSIGGVLAIGLLASGAVEPKERVTQFLVSITWLMCLSLILTGPLQLLFARYVADRIYEKRRDCILPNLLGALAVTTLASGGLSSLLVYPFFDESLACRALLVANFVVLCDGWVLVVLLSGVKAYKTVAGLFLAAYLTSVGAAAALRAFGLEGLLAGFLVGQAGALFGMLALVLRAFPGEPCIRFQFLDPRQAHYELAAIGAVFYLGVWADKALFWLNPGTSEPVLGPLRYSVIYDLPIFFAYLSAIPAMAAFFLRLEADFADRCQEFFAAVRDGAPLHRLIAVKEGMVACVRRGLVEIMKLQGATLVLVFVAGPSMLRAAGISPLYLRLLYVDAAAVCLQVLFLAVLNVLFYLDQRKVALALSAVFAVGNVALTLLTQLLGPQWYGFGFAAAALIASGAGLSILSRKLDRLERDTFMSQPVGPAARRSQRPSSSVEGVCRECI